jgi:hypothetical protein
MPRGDKSSYTDKQKRQAEHIEEGYEKKGSSSKRAERIAWATVNKESGGGKKSGSGSKGKSKSKSKSKSASKGKSKSKGASKGKGKKSSSHSKKSSKKS